MATMENYKECAHLTNIMNIKVVSVDLQKEFSTPGGKHYRVHSNIKFIKDTLVPYLREKDMKIAEIISDYRKPRPGDSDDSTRPGEEGYKSELQDNIKLRPVWVKCMNSPIWTRKNIGNPNKKPGLPYQDPKSFGIWVHKVIGTPIVFLEYLLTPPKISVPPNLLMDSYSESYFFPPFYLNIHQRPLQVS